MHTSAKGFSHMEEHLKQFEANKLKASTLKLSNLTLAAVKNLDSVASKDMFCAHPERLWNFFCFNTRSFAISKSDVSGVYDPGAVL